MTDRDIERRLRYLNSLFKDIAVAVIGFNDFRLSVRFRAIGNIIHLPEYICQKLFLFVCNRSNFLRVFRVGCSLYRIDGKYFRPYCTGTGHFKIVIRIICLDGIKLVLVILIDFHNNLTHGLGTVVLIFAEKENTKAGAYDERNQANNHDYYDCNPAARSDSRYEFFYCRDNCFNCRRNRFCRRHRSLISQNRRLSCNLCRFLCRLCSRFCGFLRGFCRFDSRFGSLFGSLNRLFS